MSVMNYPRGAFPSADMDAKRAQQIEETEQTLSPAYRLAFLDQDLLLRSSLRPIRLQLEMMKPEIILTEEGIESTIVIFGSARLPDPDSALSQMEEARRSLAQLPEDTQRIQKMKQTERALEMSRYYDEARKLARLISDNTGPNRHVVITGGGGGIMEAANRGAFDAGAKSIGLNIVLPFEQAPNAYITPELCFQFHYFAIRKMHFLMRAKALVAFPGGFGTLDELFEALTLIQTGKMEKLPVLLFGKEFWHNLINFDYLVEQGTISASDLSLFQYVSTAEEAWEIIRASNGL
ncbi:TIGR00730 family Rossman fold protein [Desulfobotulus sp.]|uniref:LOG family protein n=1 Tax=Desulfobotulus sp. TaxID=1940337 RepID=UPI002A36B428|nr:TIGR00730 family Rossman fold protein [Desulfobotulus sp.]MDY0163959.1 TIGR00730 family Rossman fold protein [Desulfobotulus sp.]